jgi:hypothetical protein
MASKGKPMLGFAFLELPNGYVRVVAQQQNNCCPPSMLSPESVESFDGSKISRRSLTSCDRISSVGSFKGG